MRNVLAVASLLRVITTVNSNYFLVHLFVTETNHVLCEVGTALFNGI